TAVDMRMEMLPKLHEAKKQDWQTYRQLSAGIQDLYLEGTVREARAGAQIVHWPEMAVSLPKEDENDFIIRAQRVMVAQVPILSTFTIYPYIGDLFAWLAVVGFVGITIVAVIQGHRARRAKKAATS
ncbi:MAG: hypothetical protein SXV54_25045, partial [Chloroflexota bacterium]|nr:hypothetical protein [Chloroflexota bacterium]